MAAVKEEDEFYPCCISWTVIPVISFDIQIMLYCETNRGGGSFHSLVTHQFVMRMVSITTTVFHALFTLESGVYLVVRLSLRYQYTERLTSRYIPLEMGEGLTTKDLQIAIEHASEKWKGKLHKYICDNCHDYCVDILNEVKHKGKSNWNDITLMIELLCNAHYVNKKRHVLTYLPGICLWSFILLCLIGFIIVLLYQLHVF